MIITSARAEQIAAFYARHADRLRRVVAANVHAPEQTIEDACQRAWAILLRHPEVTIKRGGFAWRANLDAAGEGRSRVLRPPRSDDGRRSRGRRLGICHGLTGWLGLR